MRTARKLIAVAAIVVVTVAAAVVVARAAATDDTQGKRRAGKRERMRERIELMKMWKLTGALDLDQKTAAGLFPMLHDYDVQQRELHQNRRDTVKRMKAELATENPDSAALRGMISEFKQNERDTVKMRNKKLDDLSEFLTDRQRAQLIIMATGFKRDMQKLVRHARARRSRRGGMSEKRGWFREPMGWYGECPPTGWGRQGGPGQRGWGGMPEEPMELPPVE